MLPAGFWVYVGFTASRNWDTRSVPRSFTMGLAKAMGAAFARAEADIRYRNRLESNRIVMLYDELECPELDLAAMDRHVANLERELGGSIDAKVYWIRGRCLGVEFVSFHGLALGSHRSPELGQQKGYRGDRHELAHAALDWFRVPGCDPPNILNEGWGMSQCGDTTLELAQAAAIARQDYPSVGIRELFGPDWYHRVSGPVYSIGGAFVDFLVRTRGATRFRRFFVECRPNTVEAKCREIYGTDLDRLEAEFWEDMEKALQNPQTVSDGLGSRT